MRKYVKIGLLITVIVGGVVVFATNNRIRAEENCEQFKENSGNYYECLGKEISDLEEKLQLSKAATAPLEAEMNKLESRIDSIQAQIRAAETRREKLVEEIEEREDNLAVQYVLLRQKLREYYKRMRSSSSMVFLLSEVGSGEVSRDLGYREVATKQDRKLILSISDEIVGLEEDKKQVEESKKELAVLQSRLDEQKEFFEGEIAGAKAYQTDLEGQIAELTSKQQQLLAEKYGSLNLPESLGAGTLYCTDDRNLNPGFSPAFAFYTYGIPHRVGMSQYGAYGRASSGQSYTQILEAYFSASLECKDMPSEILVEGYGVRSMDDYVKGVVNKEMGADLVEALKAQAVAARSYALAYTNNAQKSICATQSCQVYSDARRGVVDGAVDATGKNVCGDGRAQVLTSNGQPVTAWYASTAGGYTFFNSDVWGGSRRPWTKRVVDASGSVGSFSDLHNKAYDKDSSCFYAAQGWRSQYDNSAWLKSEEVADIVNVLMLANKDSSTQVHLPQVDKPNPDGKETWDAERVKSELRSKDGNPYNSVSSVSVSVDFGTGRVTSVTVSGDTGTKSFDGSRFIDYFNLRAPANIQIVGPLFNVETK